MLAGSIMIALRTLVNPAITIVNNAKKMEYAQPVLNLVNRMCLTVPAQMRLIIMMMAFSLTANRNYIRILQ